MKNVGMAITAALLLSCVAARGGEPRIPVIHSTDLCHPPVDADDHFDLACLFALKEFDIRAIVLDAGELQAKGSGRPALEQMMHITGRRVPYATGLNASLRNSEDKGQTQDAAYQGGVELILSALRGSPEKVVIQTMGSCRDVAAAFNRDPQLLREKVRGIYMNIGRGPHEAQNEYNVSYDWYAYMRMFESGLPVYWCPCFANDRFQTFYEADQSTLLDACAPQVRNFFVYCLTKSEADPIAFLSRPEPVALPPSKRGMFCMAPMFHAVGRKIYQRGPDDFVALSPSDAQKAGLAGKEVGAYEFVPMLVNLAAVHDGLLDVAINPPEPSGFVFAASDPQYSKILASCSKNLLAELGR